MESSLALLNKEIASLVWKGCHTGRTNLRFLFFAIKTFFRQKLNARLREKHAQKWGVVVPSFMIVSMTKKCNLHCKGCYSEAFSAKTAQKKEEMDYDQLLKTLLEAENIGVSFTLLAGGEPLLRREDILKIASKCKNMVFPVFTNGTLIDECFVRAVKKRPNIIPVLSVEGFGQETDNRRGSGIFEILNEKMRMMKETGQFFGVSITITRNNFLQAVSENFVRSLYESGCRLFLFVEYVPVADGTEELVVSTEMRQNLTVLLEEHGKNFPALFISFPGDEQKYGGCLSSGRGFIHISPSGNIEPCPFAPYSDSNINGTTLIEALKSDFLRKIRENHAELRETENGCALWNKKEWVASLLK